MANKTSKIDSKEGMRYEDLSFNKKKQTTRKMGNNRPIVVKRGTAPRSHSTANTERSGRRLFNFGISLFLISLWVSGYFAGSPTDRRFESLLSVVLGIAILGLVLGKLSSKE